MRVQDQHAGFFEARALAGRAYRREAMEEFDADDLEPLEVRSFTKSDIFGLRVSELKRQVRDKTVLFVEDRGGGRGGALLKPEPEVYAVVLPPSLLLLLEIRDVLNDTRLFRVVDRGLASIGALGDGGGA